MQGQSVTSIRKHPNGPMWGQKSVVMLLHDLFHLPSPQVNQLHKSKLLWNMIYFISDNNYTFAISSEHFGNNKMLMNQAEVLNVFVQTSLDRICVEECFMHEAHCLLLHTLNGFCVSRNHFIVFWSDLLPTQHTRNVLFWQPNIPGKHKCLCTTCWMTFTVKQLQSECNSVKQPCVPL